MNTVVDIERLTKVYGKVKAVDEISFSLEEGKIYGLLGRNGAGKTTIMQMITTQIFATSGELKVFGEAPYENRRVLDRICFIRENQKYPQTFRVMDVLDMSAVLFPQWDREYAAMLVEDFRLPLKRRIKALSRGMLSAMGIVVGLASRAPLTLFDEPYLGLDAVARSIFYERLIEDYAQHPRTIVLSTHLIDEMSQLLEHIIVIDEGKLLINDEADALRGRAFTLVGLASKVEVFAAGKEIMHREPFGALVATTIQGKLDMGDRKRAEELGLEIMPVSLQQLIVYLTNDKSTRKVVEV